MKSLLKQSTIFRKDQLIENLIESFISSLDIKESSKDLYKKTLNQYLNWVESKKYNLADLSRREILEYKKELLSNKSSLTVASYLNSVRRFYEWAESNKYYPNIAKGVKSPNRKQQFKKQPLNPDQAALLLDFYKGKNIRDNAIINLLLRTGLRTIEVTRASIEDIVFKGSQPVLLVKGKGRDEKDNFVILTSKSYAPISEYLLTRKKAKGIDPLFISVSNNSNGNKLSTKTVSSIAKTALKAIGLNDKGYTAHSLRHTAAVSILRAGGDLEMVQFTLRHSNPATTQIYTATIDEERRLKNSGEALLDTIY